MRIGPMEIILILLAVTAVVGTKQLPKLGRAAGQAANTMKENTKEFTAAIKAVEDEMKDIKEMVTVDITSEEKE